MIVWFITFAALYPQRGYSPHGNPIYGFLYYFVCQIPDIRNKVTFRLKLGQLNRTFNRTFNRNTAANQPIGYGMGNQLLRNSLKDSDS